MVMYFRTGSSKKVLTDVVYGVIGSPLAEYEVTAVAVEGKVSDSEGTSKTGCKYRRPGYHLTTVVNILVLIIRVFQLNGVQWS